MHLSLGKKKEEREEGREEEEQESKSNARSERMGERLKSGCNRESTSMGRGRGGWGCIWNNPASVETRRDISGGRIYYCHCTLFIF